jgi:hypothetical protein
MSDHIQTIEKEKDNGFPMFKFLTLDGTIIEISLSNMRKIPLRYLPILVGDADSTSFWEDYDAIKEVSLDSECLNLIKNRYGDDYVDDPDDWLYDIDPPMSDRDQQEANTYYFLT